MAVSSKQVPQSGVCLRMQMQGTVLRIPSHTFSMSMLTQILPQRLIVCPAESPQWRRGPPAKPILCNACGTRFRRTHHLGPPIPSSGRIGGPRPLVPGSLARSGSGSSGGSTPGRKRAAAAEALGPAPLPVNFDGGVHTGTRLARNPSRPLPKQYKVEDL
jgi:hypothetical protein